MNSSSATRDLVAGVFVLIGLAAIGYLSLQLGGLTLGKSGGMVLFATFDDIGGLSPRAPVRIAGVRVGQVESISLDDDLRAKVVLDLAADLEISIDTAAAIRTSGLLGDQFISLELGAEDEIMKAGGNFAYTESAMNLDKLIGSLVHGSALGDDE